MGIHPEEAGYFGKYKEGTCTGCGEHKQLCPNFDSQPREVHFDNDCVDCCKGCIKVAIKDPDLDRVYATYNGEE